MNQSARTITFVAVAAGSVVVAFLSHRMTMPPEVAGFEKVGQDFYPDFDDPSEAKGLRVVSYNEDTASARMFNVDYKDGRWRIPSHHNYPADGEDRLAQTAASVLKIKRGALASRRPTDHERFGVIDPLDEGTATLKGRGQRVTLFKEGNVPLVDFIIGKQVEGEDNVYYVRAEGENDTYITEFEIDLSTKFSDWVERDLLEFDRDSLVEMEALTSDVDAERRIVPKTLLTIDRETSSDSWTLDGLDEATEQIKTTEVNQLVNALDNLELVGVRPKPRGDNDEPLLTTDLKFNPPKAASANPIIMQAVQQSLLQDLADKGFFLATGSDDKTRIVSREGELVASTNEGLAYKLFFGNQVTGTEEEIEIGGSKDSTEETEEEESGDEQSGEDETEPEGTESDSEEEEAEEADDEEEGPNRSRYIFVNVEFDESLLGDKPVEPVKPEEPPQIEDEADDADGPGDGDTTENGDADDSENSEADSDDSDADEAGADAGENEEEAEPDPQEEYEKALAQYNADLMTYQAELDAYGKKIEDGKKKAKELSDRFADWYYLISAESAETLMRQRSDYVEPKEEEEDESDAGSAAGLGDSLPTGGIDSSPDGPATNDPAVNSDATELPSTPDSENAGESPTDSTDDSPDGDADSETAAESDGTDSDGGEPSTEGDPAVESGASSGDEPANPNG